MILIFFSSAPSQVGHGALSSVKHSTAVQLIPGDTFLSEKGNHRRFLLPTGYCHYPYLSQIDLNSVSVHYSGENSPLSEGCKGGSPLRSHSRQS